VVTVTGPGDADRFRDATRVIRAGLPARAQGAPLLPGPTFASMYHLSGEPEDSEFTYGRNENPTWTAFERAVGELEGGRSVAFASGMAAVTAVLGAVLRPGDTLVLPSDAYYNTRALAEQHFGAWGVQVRSAPTAGGAQRDLLEGARLLWLETPSNPGLDVCDVAGLAGAAREAGALVAVDNTTATPLGQRPLALGADFSVASDTKALTGHGDLVLGHVATRDKVWRDRLVAWRSRFGAIPGPMETWLAHRSLGTLALRLERMCENAQAIAEMLAGHAGVSDVRYPGLPGHPGHEIAARQMARFGPVVSFALPDRAAAERFLAAGRIFLQATSFGGLHTTAERRARWGGDPVPEGFIRLSAGCEDVQDLRDDLARALRATRT
jgi:cystathionine gamma-lyase